VYFENVLTEVEDSNGLFADLQRTMKELGIGIFRVESADLERRSFVVTVAEVNAPPGIAGRRPADPHQPPRRETELLALAVFGVMWGPCAARLR
jgi:hypothetical protein